MTLQNVKMYRTEFHSFGAWYKKAREQMNGRATCADCWMQVEMYKTNHGRTAKQLEKNLAL